MDVPPPTDPYTVLAELPLAERAYTARIWGLELDDDFGPESEIVNEQRP